MTNQHRTPAANSIRHGAQSVLKSRTARSRNTGALRLVGENERSNEYGRLPIWMAALFTSDCRATAPGSDCDIQWRCIDGRAHYTNDAGGALLIEPLGIRLENGQTLAASWTPGETSYTFEILRQHERLRVTG